MSMEEFESLMEEISNWGRWGEDDELGTLNLITPEKRRAAAGLVTEGISVSLSLTLDREKSDHNPYPFEHQLSMEQFGTQTGAVDYYGISYHSTAHSHIDGLAHVLHRGRLYNGFTADVLKPDGAEKLGIHHMKDGIISRGVLVDMAWLKGVDYLEPGTAITIADLEEWEARTGITVGSGDVLLLRTGRWELHRQRGQISMMTEGLAGFHASVAKWLRQRDVAAIGSDGGSDVIPSGVEELVVPLHALALVGLGMPMLDNLDLDAASRQARDFDNRWTFLFVAAPLRVEGGTGSPLNPLAVF
ncbi:cyclase family protein [Stutzerimonas frequens]|uniref:cyclase family protein n=1 Tax=Stutzerimonas frequens TaxID=2968969 RepID=UPI003749DAE2